MSTLERQRTRAPAHQTLFLKRFFFLRFFTLCRFIFNLRFFLVEESSRLTSGSVPPSRPASSAASASDHDQSEGPCAATDEEVPSDANATRAAARCDALAAGTARASASSSGVAAGGSVGSSAKGSQRCEESSGLNELAVGGGTRAGGARAPKSPDEEAARTVAARRLIPRVALSMDARALRASVEDE